MPDSETHDRAGRALHTWMGSATAATHFLTPASVPLLSGLSITELPLYALAVWCGARLGARLPDHIEPPHGPRHRGLAHSIATYLVLVAKVVWLWIGVGMETLETPWTYGRVFLFFLGLSYLTHLHMDAHTPQSLPWLQ